MTFSITGHCARTNMTGVAITTSSICVASRCPWVRAEVGAVATQNVTDPSLGPLLLDLLAQGHSPEAAITKLLADREHTEYRQLTVVDIHGNTAHHTGAQILGINAIATAPHCIAAGNLLQNPGIPEAMVKHFDTHPELHLAERLLQSLQAGIAAGGEQGPVHSAGLKVAYKYSWPLVDLRVDWHDDDPVGTLQKLWRAYEPEVDAYTTRAINPSAAPSYGVPGDL